MKRLLAALLIAGVLVAGALPAAAQAPESTELFEGYNPVVYPENYFQGWPVDWQPIGVAEAIYQFDPQTGWHGWFKPVAIGQLPAVLNSFWTLTPDTLYWVFVTDSVTIQWFQ